MTIDNHTINVGTQIRLTADSFTFTCTQDGNSAEKTYPRATAGDGSPDPAYNTALDVTAVGTTTQNISSASYNPTSGILTVDTSGAHGLSTGNRIQIADNSLTFTCAYDSNATQHTYPRQTDPIRGEWVEVTVVDSDTFTIDIGTSTDTSTHSFVSATAGALIKQTGTVTINVGVSAQADQYAHTFVSAAANAVVTGGNYVHTFVSAVANSVISDTPLNCEDDIRDTLNAIAQDLRNGSNNHIWDAASYYVDRTQNPVQIAQIEPAVKETLFAYEKVDDMLQYIITNTLWPIQGDHGLTQTTDARITDSTTTSLTSFTPSNATYNAATGDLVLTIGTHSLTTSSRVKIATGGITFTCTKDGNESQHSYPRVGDPAENAVLAVTAVVANTSITVNVGASGPNDQYAHTFVSALTNAVTELDYSTSDCTDVFSTVGNLIDILTDTITQASASTPVDHLASVTKVSPAYEYLGATVDAYSQTPFTIDYHSSGDDEIYTNQIDLDGRSRYRDAADLIRANRGAIVDKAAYDMLQRYPALAQDMPRNQNGGSTDGTLRCKTDLGLILDGIAKDIEQGGNLETTTAAKFYVGASGELLHIRLQVWQSVYAHERLAFYTKQAITGDLTADNTDNLIVGDWGITDDAVQQFTATGATYDPATGLVVATIGSHTLDVGVLINIADNSLTFTCTQDGNGSNHSYPRSTDPASGANLPILAKTATTITFNVGVSSASDQYAHTFVSATTNGITTVGQCANVKAAIDTLVTTINDIIAPTGEDFNIGGDRLYFNREYIREEATSLTQAFFTYDLNGTPFQAFNYGNNLAARRQSLEDIMIGVISDLQTGGSNSTIQAAEAFLSAQKTILTVNEELTSWIYSLERVKLLAEKAISNLLYTKGNAVTGQQYAAVYTDQEAFRDSLTPTNINQVVWRMRELLDIAINIFSPGKLIARNASKNLLYNVNYYKNELNNIVNAQFGSGAWVYNDFVDEMINNVIHDFVTTDVTDKQNAYEITLQNVTGNYVVGETAVSNNGGRATILEWDVEFSKLYVSSFNGSAFVAGDTISGTNAGSGTVASGGVGTVFDWYNNPTNIEVIASARNITSNVQGQVSTANLIAQPEALNSGFGTGLATINANAANGPDGTLTAESVIPTAVAGQHIIFYNHTISAFETFDSGLVKFDSGNETFDTGNIGTAEDQQFTFSIFLKQNGTFGDNARIMMSLDEDTSNKQQAFFDINLVTGVAGNFFQPQGGITVDSTGVIPYGDGWYRVFITITFSFGFSQIRNQIFIDGAQSYTGDGSTGLYAWGAKLNKGALDPYTAQSGELFYSDNEFNIKNFTLDRLEEFMTQALTGTLTSPSTNAGFFAYYDATAAATYNLSSVNRIIRNNFDIIRNQFLQDTFYTNLTTLNGITVPTKTYGTRQIPTGIAGGLNNSDYLYGTQSDSYGELERITLNEGQIVQVYKRMRIDGDIINGPFTMGETLAKQGDTSITGVVYGFFEDANYKYLDVRVTGGVWAITDTMVGAANGTTAQISAIENRLQVNKLQGAFVNDILFKGYTSEVTASPTGFLQVQGAVLNNTGGKLTIDTETFSGAFETTSTLYPSASEIFVEVVKYDGLDVAVGDRINSAGHTRIGISIQGGVNTFQVGDKIHRVDSNFQNANVYGYITEVDLDNNFIYYKQVVGADFAIGQFVGAYGAANDPFNPIGYAQVSTVVQVAGAASGIVQDIETVGINKRIYLADIRGAFSGRDGIIGPDNYKASINELVNLKARVKRSFRGFDGTQTNFKLTTANGTPYFPDPAGHMLIFINGVLQPPGATFAFTAFSDEIAFTEAPDLGASFTGFYIGKLRQLDDISFEFDSLRQSFNLKRDDVFYSLTLTEGVQSTTIRPENNIIVSLNGVLQEPGVGFEIVGSRIIFSEIPRFGSTFVAFSYVGSEADVDAAEVVPPVEPGDFIDIQGETADREVAVIESSNSLITFDYLGSVFGNKGQGTALLTTGQIDKVQITSGGSGYTSRPTVRIDSISGFEGNIKALVGVAAVEISATGTGYKNPSIGVATSVPDDWTAPDLSQYGEELVDPETP